MDVLDPNLATDLIAQTSGYTTADARKTLDAITEELGRLPLALEQAAAYLRESPMTNPQTYLEDLRRHPMRMYGEANEGTLAERTIARLWDTHLAILQERDAAQQLQSEHLLRTLACYAPDNIPVTLLSSGSDDWATRQALKLLTSYNMITYARVGEDATA
ncbi:hypothetical protein ACSDR0_44595 [Streptosporangium sp. G11]|uniref:hypothetical protein n=1 Tax=Streptosporangium sp. G11 TaxID=3436926 RepID=UPI003EC019C7